MLDEHGQLFSEVGAVDDLPNKRNAILISRALLDYLSGRKTDVYYCPLLMHGTLQVRSTWITFGQVRIESTIRHRIERGDHGWGFLAYFAWLCKRRFMQADDLTKWADHFEIETLGKLTQLAHDDKALMECTRQVVDNYKNLAAKYACMALWPMWNPDDRRGPVPPTPKTGQSQPPAGDHSSQE